MSAHLEPKARILCSITRSKLLYREFREERSHSVRPKSVVSLGVGMRFVGMFNNLDKTYCKKEILGQKVDLFLVKLKILLQSPNKLLYSLF